MLELLPWHHQKQQEQLHHSRLLTPQAAAAAADGALALSASSAEGARAGSPPIAAPAGAGAAAAAGAAILRSKSISPLLSVPHQRSHPHHMCDQVPGAITETKWLDDSHYIVQQGMPLEGQVRCVLRTG